MRDLPVSYCENWYNNCANPNVITYQVWLPNTFVVMSDIYTTFWSWEVFSTSRVFRSSNSNREIFSSVDRSLHNSETSSLVAKGRGRMKAVRTREMDCWNLDYVARYLGLVGWQSQLQNCFRTEWNSKFLEGLLWGNCLLQMRGLRPEGYNGKAATSMANAGNRVVSTFSVTLF